MYLIFTGQGGLKTETLVFTAVKKEIVNKIIVENRTDFVDYLYFLASDIIDKNL